ncbi:MAG: hypothetical protein C0622_03230 [Desulfuromonas sp.]|nr:MAG: hypothetical protein C0622_03230 [Desulfuromonas sp.]
MQLTARKILRKTSFWLEKATGMPRRLWFRVDFEELEKILKNQQFPGYRGTSVRQAREQDGRFSGYMVTEIPGALQAESTSDINTETTTGITREQAAEGGGIFLEKRIDQISLQEEYLSLLKRYGDARSYVALVSAKRKQWQNQGNLSARDNEQLSEWRKKEEVAEIRRKNNHQIQKEDIRYEEVASEDFQRNLESLPSEIRRAIQGAVNSQSQNKTVP